MAWLSKPEPMARVRARRKRAEKKVKDVTRAEVARRDGYCRFTDAPDEFDAVVGPCEGKSERNHLRKQSLTRNQDAEVRHSPATSIMNCKRHHDMVDQHKIQHEALTAAGAKGPMRFTSGGVSYVSTPRGVA